MPRIRFDLTRGVDVFAFVDSDSPEAKGFTTHFGYWRAFRELILLNHGEDYVAGVHAALAAVPAFGNIAKKPFTGDREAIQKLLLNSWATELGMYVVDPKAAALVRVANHISPVQAYFATAQAGLAWIRTLNDNVPNGHRHLLRALSHEISERPTLYTYPWNLRCTECEGRTRYAGFQQHPVATSNLASAVAPEDRVGQCLHTTRQRGVKHLVDETKRQLKRKRAPNGERFKRDAALEPTTVFDFLWRARTRSSYGDPAMYYMGQLSEADALAYAAAVKTVTAATSFLFTALIAQRAPGAVDEAATHFISRDRSRLTDEVLVPRMAQLGMAANAPHRQAS